MRKKHYLLIFLAILLTVFLSGCLKPQQKEAGPKRPIFSSVKIPKSNNPKRAASVVYFTKSYLKKAFFDLKLAKTDSYKSEVVTFFDESVAERAGKDWQILSLGSEGKKLDTIFKSSLQFKSISIYYDKLTNTSLSVVGLVLKAQYTAKNKPVFLTFSGNISLARAKGGWKILSYKLKQDLHTKK